MSSFVSLTDLVYPVGSYYLSNTSGSPASRFGGAWSQITDWRFLRGGTDTSYGGDSTHTHIYGVRMYTNTGRIVCPHSWGDNGIISLMHHGTSDLYYASTNSTTATLNGYCFTPVSTRNACEFAEVQDATAETGYASNFPPYRTCYMWYRTA